MANDLKIAFIQDALPFIGGAEKVLAAALEVYPQAPVFTLIYNRENFRGSNIAGHSIIPSFIDRLPGAHRRHRAYLPLMPLGLEMLDLREFEVVVAFSYAVAHAAPTRPDQLHISYIHTPLRYAWGGAQVGQAWPIPLRPFFWMIRPYLALFRWWERSRLSCTNYFLTNSRWMAGCIQKAYHRQAEVLYPPVDTGRFRAISSRRDYFITVSRLVAHKRLDVVVKAFTRLGLPLFVVGEGPERYRLQKAAGPNIQFLGQLPDAIIAALLGRARAFIHAGEEDFGIAMVEAQAAGCPVLALNGGAAPELIRDGQNGVLFEGQSVQAIIEAVLRFDRQGVDDSPEMIRAGAQRFNPDRFKRDFKSSVEEKWAAFRRQLSPGLAHPVLEPEKGKTESLYEYGD